MDRATTEPDVGNRLDHMPVTLLHCLIVGLCAFGFAFDLFEINLGSALSAVFSAPPHAAAPAQLSMLLSSVYVGAVIGAPLVGWLADRYGRRTTLISVLLFLAAASLGGASSGDITELTYWRCLAGLAVGSYPPLMFTYLADMLPAGRRGMLSFIAVGIGMIGPVAGILLIRALVPIEPFGIEGWRWGFIAGSAGAGMVGLLFFALPESPRWLQSRQRVQEAHAQCSRLENSPMVMPSLAPRSDNMARAAPQASGRRPWPLLATLFFLASWSTVAFPLLTGAMLTQKGFRLSDTLLYVGLSSFGPMVGTLLASLGVDRIGRRAAMAACAVAMMAAGAVFVAANTPVVLTASSFLFGLFVSLFLSVLNLYASEHFPTASRGTSIAAAWACNRVGAACAPLLLLPLLKDSGPEAMFAVILSALVTSILLLKFAPPGSPCRAVG